MEESRQDHVRGMEKVKALRRKSSSLSKRRLEDVGPYFTQIGVLLTGRGGL